MVISFPYRPDWNYVPKNKCPKGSAAIGYSLKIQPFADLKDRETRKRYGGNIVTNRAIVGLRLHCGDKSGNVVSTIESEMVQK